MLASWLALLLADEGFAAALIFGLTGLDGSFWLISKPAFAQIAEVLRLPCDLPDAPTAGVNALA